MCAVKLYHKGWHKMGSGGSSFPSVKLLFSMQNPQISWILEVFFPEPVAGRGQLNLPSRGTPLGILSQIYLEPGHICTRNTTTCPQTCTEGCQCHHGPVFDRHRCVPKDYCGCFRVGEYYKPHEMLFQDHCQRHCTCVPGQGLACHDHACTEDKSCEIQEKVLGCIKKALTLTYKEPAPTSWPNPMGTTLGCCPSGSRPRMTSVVGSNLCPISPWSMLTSMDNTSPSTGMKMAESGVNREVMLLPVLLADGKVRVRPTGLRVVLDTDFGLRVSYYWNWHPRSTSPAATSAKSVASAGISTSSPLMISPRLVYHCNYHMGQIWKSADSEVNHWICWGYCDGPCPVCDEEKKELYGGNHYCGIIKKSFQGPFRA
ncbi:IgGFc-binding protein-like isoform X3 [Vidua chalybeata]|uniref:IgGFc-binding protein-like isoform X3 n=1 Tax=Vidua chalybeata TaxID=81927 RepID=UPI0023A84382|nr:IgGFc-binding protein-like isoform X3 [Vidua chalybeata]